MSANGKNVKLDQTVYYAFSGGQESDTGSISGIPVVNAVKQGDKESIIDIEYELEKEPYFKVGDTVTVTIDSERRKKLRNLHSASHILYYFLADKIGEVKIMGSHIGEKKARIDFKYEKSISNIIPEIEQEVNDFLKENHMIIMNENASKTNLRWWSCNNWKIPCGGTHPKSTKEIGKVKLKRKNIGSQKERIEIYLVQ